MTPSDYEFVTRLLAARTAIQLGPDKAYLVESRLGPVAHRMGLQTIEQFIEKLRSASTYDPLINEFVDAMVTTETMFFRDGYPFDAIRTVVLPKLIEARRTTREITIWSAASSSGQEAYSIAMLIREHFPELSTWKVRILATDVSADMLRRAREGRYSSLEIKRGLPPDLRDRYFRKVENDWQLRDDVRGLVTFQQVNLVTAWPHLPVFDLILIRNVMIYFDAEAKKVILDRVARQLRPDGYLILGGAETPLNLVETFRRIEPMSAGLFQPMVK